MLTARARSAGRLLVQPFSRYAHAIATHAYPLPEHGAQDASQKFFASPRSTSTGCALTIRSEPGSVNRPGGRASTGCLPGPVSSVRRMPPTVSSEWASSAMEQLERVLSVPGAIARLPDNCREILDRVFAHHHSCGEIAGVLTLPPATVASRSSRCLTNSRDMPAEIAG